MDKKFDLFSQVDFLAVPNHLDANLKDYYSINVPDTELIVISKRGEVVIKSSVTFERIVNISSNFPSKGIMRVFSLDSHLLSATQPDDDVFNVI